MIPFEAFYLNKLNLPMTPFRRIIQGLRTMATAIENLNTALVAMTNAVNNAAAKLNTPSDAVPAAKVQAVADALGTLATNLQTAVDNHP